MEQPNHTNLLTRDFFMEHYVKNRMSYPKLRELLLKDGHNIHIGTLHKYAKQHGIGRNASEAKRNWDPDPLDDNVSYLSPYVIECIDGFLLGDGSINTDPRSSVDSGRLCCGQEHEMFAHYLMKPFDIYKSTVKPYAHSKMSSGIVWSGSTKFHPDLYQQHQRWYLSGTKQPPNDVRITPTSVMMWYLGDGSVVINEKKDTIHLRLSTDGFSQERVEFLADRLTQIGIFAHRNNDNRIMVEARGIPKFFDFIGRKSPVSCYDYKFELPEWRFEAKRMREVADKLGIKYDVLSYWVKIGRVPCLRTSEKAKPRFLPEHIETIKKQLCTIKNQL